MATELQQKLRRLCSGTDWTYAVFWRLKSCPRTYVKILTWDDAYYDNCGKASFSKVNCSAEVVDHFDSPKVSNDLLGSALAKLSNHVYSLGEGIVGQIAVTGKHKWILFDDYLKNSHPSIEDSDAWRTQILAGVKTVLLVAVPYGVVQLGSLKNVNEDMKLVTHIRDACHSLQDASLQHQFSGVPCDIDKLLHETNLPLQALFSEVILDNEGFPDSALHGFHPNDCSSKGPYSGKQMDCSDVLPEHGVSSKASVKVFSDSVELRNCQHDQNCQLLEEISNVSNLENYKQVDVKQYSGKAVEGETNSLDHTCSVTKSNPEPYFQKLVGANLFNISLPAEAFAVDLPFIPSGISNSSTCDGYGADGPDTNKRRLLQISQPSEELQKGLMKKPDIGVGLNYSDTPSTTLRFSTISELHEALGPGFPRTINRSDSEEQKIESQPVKVLEEINNSQFTNESGSDLLEAIVAKACQNSFDDKSEKSFLELREHLLSITTTSEPASFSKLTINSGDYSFDQQSHMKKDGFQSSERSHGMSLSAISSVYPGSGVEMVRRSSEPAKSSRKRSRPGENHRPRPRDRQLIQDRLKELRELVPNGAKCSIDSLLERTIKHMLFLQSITKLADKLNQCTETKFRHGELGMRGSSNYDQGSSWAVEVGSHLKVHSIMVENLSENGQLLVEMSCEDCSHFLEIAEAMRNLGLTILKGATEAHGDKTWICFVVEGQNNRSLHRMDILWSIMQILQLKASSV